ncbi:MAG TPA: class I adenylate-forming enzyme family protein, partial [Candidatus Kryptonia bacterium]|nr:class I adenylate-forming enzyme family protein [Candidatus Kryptonia bacterium]
MIDHPASAIGGARMRAKNWPVPRFRDKLRILVREANRLSMATLPDRLAELYGERPALFLDQPLEYPFFRGDCVTYRDFAAFVARIAHGLRKLGVQRGDRVGLMTGNRIEAAFAEFAANKLGAVAVPLNVMLRLDEIRYLVDDCGMRTFITDRNVFQNVIGERSALPAIRHWLVVTTQDVPPGVTRLSDLIAGEPDAFPPTPLSPEALALIFYTAGTTGFPKGAMLSDAALMFAVRSYGKLIAFLPTQRYNLSLLVMPLAHTSGHQALLLQLVMGMPMLLMGRFDPQRVLAAIQEYKVTMFSGIPAMYRMLLAAGARDYDLTSIALFGGGGDAFPDELIHTFRQLAAKPGWFGRTKRPRFARGYGLAETAGQLATAFGRPCGDGAAGKIMRGVQYKIVDAEGREVRPGEIGELVVKTPGIMSGYWNNPDETAKVLKDGWFRTGDLVREGRRRMLFMQAREKDMIKVGGYSVFPAEVERKLAEHPAVMQVAVVGVPHGVKGEMPVAAVVREPNSDISEDALLAWAKEHIAPYKAPRRIVFVDAIPQNFAMKAKRREVREQVMALLSASDGPLPNPPPV